MFMSKLNFSSFREIIILMIFPFQLGGRRTASRVAYGSGFGTDFILLLDFNTTQVVTTFSKFW